MTITLDLDRAEHERGYVARTIDAALSDAGRSHEKPRDDDEAIRAALAFDDVQLSWTTKQGTIAWQPV